MVYHRSFEEAFDTMTGSCMSVCECGRIFYNDDGWDFEEGELESYRNDPNATYLDYAVPRVMFEGIEYVTDCDCWHKRAKAIIGFIDSHNHQIAHYLTLEKKRKQKEADNSPVVG